jgi:hypothetical protein
MPGEVSEGFLTKLTDRRARVYEAAERLLIEARSQGRQILNEGEDRRYRQAQSDLTALDEQIAEYREDLERSGIPAHLSRLSPTNPQTTSRNTMNHADARDLIYRRGDPRQSWCRDLIRLSLNLDSDGESRARLASHAQQVVDHPAFQEHHDLSRVDGSGGYAVPPAWLMNQYIELWDGRRGNPSRPLSVLRRRCDFAAAASRRVSVDAALGQTFCIPYPLAERLRS